MDGGERVGPVGYDGLNEGNKLEGHPDAHGGQGEARQDAAAHESEESAEQANTVEAERDPQPEYGHRNLW